MMTGLTLLLSFPLFWHQSGWRLVLKWSVPLTSQLRISAWHRSGKSFPRSNNEYFPSKLTSGSTPRWWIQLFEILSSQLLNCVTFSIHLSATISWTGDYLEDKITQKSPESTKLTLAPLTLVLFKKSKIHTTNTAKLKKNLWFDDQSIFFSATVWYTHIAATLTVEDLHL